MQKIENLSSLQGRKLLRYIYNELRFDKQRSSLSTLFICWRIACFEKHPNKYSSVSEKIAMPLGLFRGTALWLEEIVNRYYFSTVNSFVYFGAAILLVLIGIRRFSENISTDLVIAGIIFEAALLIFMFIVMLFTPAEYDIDEEEEDKDELLDEIGEVGRDIASVAIQLESVSNNLTALLEKQEQILEKFSEIASINRDAVSPNPKMLDSMDKTNNSLLDFNETVDKLNKSVLSLRKEEIEHSVRKELERIISNKLSKDEEDEK